MLIRSECSGSLCLERLSVLSIRRGSSSPGTCTFTVSPSSMITAESPEGRERYLWGRDISQARARSWPRSGIRWSWALLPVLRLIVVAIGGGPIVADSLGRGWEIWPLHALIEKSSRNIRQSHSFISTRGFSDQWRSSKPVFRAFQRPSGSAKWVGIAEAASVGVVECHPFQQDAPCKHSLRPSSMCQKKFIGKCIILRIPVKNKLPVAHFPNLSFLLVDSKVGKRRRRSFEKRPFEEMRERDLGRGDPSLEFPVRSKRVFFDSHRRHVGPGRREWGGYNDRASVQNDPGGSSTRWSNNIILSAVPEITSLLTDHWTTVYNQINQIDKTYSIWRWCPLLTLPLGVPGHHIHIKLRTSHSSCTHSHSSCAHSHWVVHIHIHTLIRKHRR